LYVNGDLTDTETVLVDVGTGFLVEKACHQLLVSFMRLRTANNYRSQKLKSAEKFYDGKVEELGANLKDLELIVQRKQTNARTVEESEFSYILFPILE
jgi:prefoldin alpha subunit